MGQNEGRSIRFAMKSCNGGKIIAAKLKLYNSYNLCKKILL
jgi:hypothetical protein